MPSGDDAPTDITITGESSVAVGDDITLTVAVEPATASQEVVWSSSDEDTATVDEDGVVTGVAAGSVTIYATSAEDTNVRKGFLVTVTGTNP